MKNTLTFLLLLLSLVTIAQAQQTNPEVLQLSINAKNFVFEARQASGIRGRMIQIDAGYTLTVTPEKVVGNLPFFGRSFQGAPGWSDAGMNFEFGEYDYSVKPRKKGGWDLTLRANGNSDVRALYLTVQKTGTASLRIISNSRMGMSYTGFIKD